ncbi:hypothetical protein [Pedobacter punctiformis]|uniref:Lipoprotein n=1 Tax=Pedobacter punctiformis TaxID=3004097 RepID=A0ABT4LCZ5_9SPHI|nr:hypothetical protein [Pedobacter sp. HCMS5-2]MCZ4245797.1 hypothetical protein [Pedobacter sp. HCMS5-2]
MKNNLKLTALSLIVGSFLFTFLMSASCKNMAAHKNLPDSFLPMQVGNYWKMSATSYTEIQDTLRIDGKLYYKFYSLVGGDATSTNYYRIDEQNRLVEGYIDEPKKVYVKASFNAKLGDIFYTLNDKTENDYQVKVVSKTDSDMVFEFDMVYHPNLKGSKHTEKYIKGKGWADEWKEVKINGIVYK